MPNFLLKKLSRYEGLKMVENDNYIEAPNLGWQKARQVLSNFYIPDLPWIGDLPDSSWPRISLTRLTSIPGKKPEPRWELQYKLKRIVDYSWKYTSI